MERLIELNLVELLAHARAYLRVPNTQSQRVWAVIAALHAGCTTLLPSATIPLVLEPLNSGQECDIMGSKGDQVLHGKANVGALGPSVDLARSILVL